jgi:hypothetical protein
MDGMAPQTDLLASFDVYSPRSASEDETLGKSEAWSRHIQRRRVGAGIVKGGLLSILASEDGDTFQRDYFLSPTNSTGHEDEFEETLEEVKKIALYSAQINRLERGSKTYFTAFKPGETEISERIDSFQWELLRPEPVKMETLESWLGYIMEREASLSAMISAIRGNRIEANIIVNGIEESFRRLNEQGIRGYPSSLDAETKTYNTVTRKYDDFIVSCEALKARLGTVMDNVRTYLSVQQHRSTIEEQKSSREQLRRLVSLQETFHKVEIFVLAVYMTEMAKIVFDEFAGGEAGLYTAIFIPVALVLAITVTNFLNRERN